MEKILANICVVLVISSAPLQAMEGGGFSGIHSLEARWNSYPKELRTTITNEINRIFSSYIRTTQAAYNNTPELNKKHIPIDHKFGSFAIVLNPNFINNLDPLHTEDVLNIMLYKLSERIVPFYMPTTDRKLLALITPELAINFDRTSIHIALTIQLVPAPQTNRDDKSNALDALVTFLFNFYYAAIEHVKLSYPIYQAHLEKIIQQGSLDTLRLPIPQKFFTQLNSEHLLQTLPQKLGPLLTPFYMRSLDLGTSEVFISPTITKVDLNKKEIIVTLFLELRTKNIRKKI